MSAPKQYRTKDKRVAITLGDALSLYSSWDSPDVIISDGPYGLRSFPGDPPTEHGLPAWYEPHIIEWSKKAKDSTTLWFWNSEIGWALVHPILDRHGWEYVHCNIWDKGVGHIAGNVNTKSIRSFPVVSEVCAQYVKRPLFAVNGRTLTMKEWLRYEWERTGLPFSKTNEACGVKDAATRKYFSKCHLWYYPPPEAFEKIVVYANKFGRKEGYPYFTIDGKTPLNKEAWGQMRSKFYCPHGVTNIWHEPPLNGKERVKLGGKAAHLNQKPLKFMRLTIESSSDPDDLIWEPFGGLCSATIAALQLGRRAVAAEINEDIYELAVKRLKSDNCSSL